MTEHRPYSTRVSEAFSLALKLHSGQRRKGTDIPYLTHLMAVAALVGECGGAEDQVIAALLHDAVEDQGGPQTRALIESRFGPEVATLVDVCTDADVRPKPPWKERKVAYIAQVRQAPAAAKLIVAADKLHNVRSITSDYRRIGDAVWGRFKASRDETIWYYESVTDALEQDWQHPFIDELRRCIAELRSLVTEKVER